jgi:hypothetical protein
MLGSTDHDGLPRMSWPVRPHINAMPHPSGWGRPRRNRSVMTNRTTHTGVHKALVVYETHLHLSHLSKCRPPHGGPWDHIDQPLAQAQWNAQPKQTAVVVGSCNLMSYIILSLAKPWSALSQWLSNVKLPKPVHSNPVYAKLVSRFSWASTSLAQALRELLVLK